MDRIIDQLVLTGRSWTRLAGVLWPGAGFAAEVEVEGRGAVLPERHLQAIGVLTVQVSVTVPGNSHIHFIVGTKVN